MALWCMRCGAFMGLREPIHDWSTDRTGLCVHCSENEMQSVVQEAKGPSKESPNDQSPSADTR
jgi:hypothetical protein